MKEIWKDNLNNYDFDEELEDITPFSPPKQSRKSVDSETIKSDERDELQSPTKDDSHFGERSNSRNENVIVDNAGGSFSFFVLSNVVTSSKCSIDWYFTCL